MILKQNFIKKLQVSKYQRVGIEDYTSSIENQFITNSYISCVLYSGCTRDDL